METLVVENIATVGAANGAVPIAVVKESFLTALWRLAHKPVHAVKTLWGVIVEKLHLSTALGYAKTAWSWITGVASKAGNWLGWTGGIGLGLLAVTTDFGRKVINKTVGTAVRTVGRVIRGVFNGLQWVLNHLGTPGKAVAGWNSMLVGLGKTQIDKGVKAFNKHVAPRVAVGSFEMDLVKFVGESMVAVKIASLIPIPFFSVIIYIILGIAVIGKLMNVASHLGMVGDAEQKASQDWYAAKYAKRLSDKASRDLAKADKEATAQMAKNEAKVAKETAKAVKPVAPVVQAPVAPEPVVQAPAPLLSLDVEKDAARFPEAAAFAEITTPAVAKAVATVKSVVAPEPAKVQAAVRTTTTRKVTAPVAAKPVVVKAPANPVGRPRTVRKATSPVVSTTPVVTPAEAKVTAEQLAAERDAKEREELIEKAAALRAANAEASVHATEDLKKANSLAEQETVLLEEARHLFLAGKDAEGTLKEEQATAMANEVERLMESAQLTIGEAIEVEKVIEAQKVVFSDSVATEGPIPGEPEQVPTTKSGKDYPAKRSHSKTAKADGSAGNRAQRRAAAKK